MHFFFILNQSVCDGGCLRPRLPRLRSVLGECRRGVRRSAQQHERLHDRQQRGRRRVVSELSSSTHIIKQTAHNYRYSLLICLGDWECFLPEASGVFLSLHLGTRRHDTHACRTSSPRSCLPPLQECHQACHLSSQHGMGCFFHSV